MINIINFHEKCILVVLLVLRVVLFILIYNLIKNYKVLKNVENESFEILWTIIPTLIILGIMVPSLELLYFSEETGGQNITNKIKIVGHQWYWSYESPQNQFEFDSYIVNKEDISLGEFRNCEVDRPLFLEVKKAHRFLITSADSIHSWAVPEFGVKVDAIPGRLNQVIVFTQEVGRFYGFCSELCGVNHRFMPIVVEVGC